jgi:hypothetical protein
MANSAPDEKSCQIIPNLGSTMIGKRGEDSPMASWPHHFCHPAIENDSGAIL